nr:protein CHROMATIN REMODELING 24 isoform X2 [Ipomoea batatas]
MADQKKKQQHLSLNQRHNRVLLDFSASHSKPPPSSRFHQEKEKIGAQGHSGDEKQIYDVPSFRFDFDSPSDSHHSLEEKEITAGKNLQDENEDIPNFGIGFDSPTASPPLEEKEITAGKNLQDENDDIPNFGIGFDSPTASPPLEEPTEESESLEDNFAPQCFEVAALDTRPKSCFEEELTDHSKSGIEDTLTEDFSHISEAAHIDSNLPGEKEKVVKRRIKGRRRLCKISDDIDRKEKNLDANEGANGLEISDFYSPPQVKNAVESDYAGGGSEIRDILNDLSSRLEILSIDRKGVKKHIDRTETKDELPEYQSADSSFSLSSDSGHSANGSGVGDAIKEQSPLDIGSRNDLEIQSLGGRDCRIRSLSEELKTNEAKRVVGKSEHVKKTSFSYNAQEDDSDDDCVLMSDKNDFKRAGRPNKNFAQEPRDCDDGDDFVSVEEHSFTLDGPNYSYKLPENVAKILYPHQCDGLKWLWSIHCQGKGGILGDDMGLGKTMQICGFLAGLFHSKLIKRAMIVAPKTLMPHWIKELSVVGLSEQIREYFGTSMKARDYELQYILQDKGVLLTTYDIVRNNVKSLCGDYYRYGDGSEDDIIWDYMILDEGHLIKNPSTQRAKSLHEIPCAHRIIISGTPIQNNLKELWALFNFCSPGLLGDNKWFKEKYEHYILRGNEKNATDREKRIGSAVAKELRERIQPYFFRRLKSEVFSEDASTSTKLSKKNEMCVWLKLTSCQRQLYVAFLKSEIVLSACDNSPLAALTILKKICDHPLLLTKRAAEEVLEGMESMSVPGQEDHAMAERLVMQMADAAEKFDIEENQNISCKITFIMQLLEFLIPNGHHVLIFSQTRRMLDQIQASLNCSGFKFLRIDGTTKAADRLKIVNDFQEGCGAPIFLLTSQVGGLGLTLTKADRVIVVDPAWNPRGVLMLCSTDNQSVDRAYRIGQKKDVIVYRLMTCGTVEEKIYRKQVFKGGLFKTATEHREQVRYFSKGDLQELFSIPQQGFDVSLTQQQLDEEHDHHHIMEGSAKAEMEFLETLDIAGVSQHSLLFSKTAPVTADLDDEDVRSVRGAATYVGNAPSRSSVEPAVIGGAQFAFNPKDVKSQAPAPKKSYNAVSHPTESEIRDRIKRLSYIFAEKGMRLPDRGEKLQKQIAELYAELDLVRNQGKANEVIDLDDISGKFERVVNV